jgi:tRNA pseudouridine13 synthase
MLRLSKGKRPQGRIKAQPEDFVVEEITKSGVVLETGRRYTKEDLGFEDGPEGKHSFSVFVMQKRDWNTASALREIARKCGRGIKSAGFAGSKDRASISTQMCSIFGAMPERLMEIHVKDISINGAWESSAGVKLGDLLGNRFSITITEASEMERIRSLVEELNGRFPNYYGEQRFGSRSNNTQVGIAIMKGDFENAAKIFLTDSLGEKNEEAVTARKRLAEEMDFAEALNYFPWHLKYERMVLESLAQNPTDYANAIRKLPRAVTLMFVHSVESEIFNRELEMRVKSNDTHPRKGELSCPPDKFGYPDLSKTAPSSGNDDQFPVGNIVGYNSESLTEEEARILGEMGLTKEDFRVKHMPELNCKGTYRTLFSPYLNMKTSEGETGTISFSLSAGSYATVLLDELIDVQESPNITQF